MQQPDRPGATLDSPIRTRHLRKRPWLTVPPLVRIEGSGVQISSAPHLYSAKTPVPRPGEPESPSRLAVNEYVVAADRFGERAAGPENHGDALRVPGGWRTKLA